MSFESKQSIFTSTELDYEEIVDIPDGYEKAELKDFEDGTLITGRPEMSSVTSYTFDDDGEEVTIIGSNYSFSKMMNSYMLKSMSTSKTMEIYTKISAKAVFYLIS